MTGGDSGKSLAGLAKMFTNPRSYNILPVRNKYNNKEEVVYTGFFMPAYSQVYDYLDHRGVTDEVKARKYYQDERDKKIDDPQNLLDYKAEYCFTPDEALIKEGDNLFDQVAISEQIAQIDIHKTVEQPRTGSLLWVKDKSDKPVGVKWTEDNRGKIQILEHPITDESGATYKNLYVAGIDSIDIGKDDSASDRDVSDFCIVIKKRVFGLNEPQYVAIYKDRPNQIREAYDTALKLLEYYDCQAVLESTRTALLTYFRDKNKLHRLMKRPRSTLSDVTKTNSHMYGAPATEKTIKHYIELIQNFIADYCHTIAFRNILDELNHYSYENKRKFDIVAALGQCELGDEELSQSKPVIRDNITKEMGKTDIGYYFDSDGIRRWGVIPTSIDHQRKQLEHDYNRIRDEYSWIHGGTV